MHDTIVLGLFLILLFSILMTVIILVAKNTKREQQNKLELQKIAMENGYEQVKIRMENFDCWFDELVWRKKGEKDLIIKD